MAGLIVIFIIWCCIAVPVGWGLAKIEGKVNGKPPRTKNVILWSVFGGIIGWIVVCARSNMTFASGFRADMKASGDVARQRLAQQQQYQPPPAVGPYHQPPYQPAQQPYPPPAQLPYPPQQYYPLVQPPPVQQPPPGPQQ